MGNTFCKHIMRALPSARAPDICQRPPRPSSQHTPGAAAPGSGGCTRSNDIFSKSVAKECWEECCQRVLLRKVTENAPAVAGLAFPRRPHTSPAILTSIWAPPVVDPERAGIFQKVLPRKKCCSNGVALGRAEETKLVTTERDTIFRGRRPTSTCPSLIVPPGAGAALRV